MPPCPCLRGIFSAKKELLLRRRADDFTSKDFRTRGTCRGQSRICCSSRSHWACGALTPSPEDFSLPRAAPRCRSLSSDVCECPQRLRGNFSHWHLRRGSEQPANNWVWIKKVLTAPFCRALVRKESWWMCHVWKFPGCRKLIWFWKVRIRSSPCFRSSLDLLRGGWRSCTGRN